MPGPPPKRSEERRRRNKEGADVERVDIATLITMDVEVPVADDTWHPIAFDWYESLKKSGQAIFYEPSDWSTAYIVAETISRELEPQPIVVTDASGEQRVEMHTVPIKGASMTAILKGMSNLMTTEAERRRLRIELDRAKAKQAIAEMGSNVVGITQNRADLFR